MTPLRIAVLGAGDHSQRNHLPALSDYATRNPGAVELAALCDLRRGHAEALASLYGFQRVYDDLEVMLASERLDGCIAVTPVPATTRLAGRILQAGIPLLMEKPPGATLAEAREFAAQAAESHTPVMVSMNRRFDPALKAGLDWLGVRQVDYVRATMARHNRREPEFFTGTAIHIIDAIRFIGGDITTWQPQVQWVDGVQWAQVALAFTNRTRGWIEILPTAGFVAESYALFGPDYHLLVRVGGLDAGEALAWENDTLVLEVQPGGDAPEYITNGTYAETEAFLAGLAVGKPLHPTPGEVLGSVELCHAIQTWAGD